MPDPAAYRRSAVPASTAGQGRPADAVAAELQLHEARPVDADRALCAGQAHRPAPGHSEVVQFLIAAVWGALLRLTVQGGTPGKQPSSRRCVPTTTGSACTPRCAARPTTDDRQALEQLCRYITRPALADERVQTNAAGQIVRKLKSP